MSRTAARTSSRVGDADSVAFGALLEPVTDIPAGVFDSLPPVAQAAVVARVAPERLRCLDAESCEAVLAVTQAGANTLSAVQDVVLAAAVRAEELAIAGLNDDPRDGSDYAPEAQKVVASSVASIFHVAPRSMALRVGRANKVVDGLPLTLAAALRGRLEPARVAVIADGALHVAHGLAFDFDLVLHADPRVTELVPGRLRRAVERAAEIVDEDAFAQRAEAALRGRFIKAGPGVEVGMTDWIASLTAQDSARVWAAIDALAQEYLVHGDRSVDQARADAFVDLILGHARVETVVELVVPTFTRATGAPPAAPAPDSEGEGEPHCDAARITPRSSAREPHPSVREPHLVEPPHDAASEPAAPPPTSATSMPADEVSPGEPLPADGDVVLEFGPVQPLPARPVIGPPDEGEGPPTPVALEQLMPLSSFFQIGSEVVPNPPPGTLPPDDPRRDWWWRPPRLGIRSARHGWLLAAALAEVLTDPDLRIRITRADAHTGVTVARDPRIYRPNKALADRIRDRDRTCRFPGCGVAATRCDIDHVIRFPEGPTSEENLVCLCRSHHGFKHHAGWKVRLESDGTCHWLSPYGRALSTSPADVRADAA
ncbi:MAG: hypothetical protein ACTHJJ_13045 [Intrasporangium sp.]|uniref:HNH endonuclease signature motif containing protein n=1 Tax=Intrasporangium sp. TaxID=1925024 RepID=UPI003F8047B0